MDGCVNTSQNICHIKIAKHLNSQQARWTRCFFCLVQFYTQRSSRFYEHWAQRPFPLLHYWRLQFWAGFHLAIHLLHVRQGLQDQVDPGNGLLTRCLSLTLCVLMFSGGLTPPSWPVTPDTCFPTLVLLVALYGEGCLSQPAWSLPKTWPQLNPRPVCLTLSLNTTIPGHT